MSSTKKYNSRLGDSKRGVEAGIAVEKDSDSGQIDQGGKKERQKSAMRCIVHTGKEIV